MSHPRMKAKARNDLVRPSVRESCYKRLVVHVRRHSPHLLQRYVPRCPDPGIHSFCARTTHLLCRVAVGIQQRWHTGDARRVEADAGAQCLLPIHNGIMYACHGPRVAIDDDDDLGATRWTNRSSVRMSVETRANHPYRTRQQGTREESSLDSYKMHSMTLASRTRSTCRRSPCWAVSRPARAVCSKIL